MGKANSYVVAVRPPDLKGKPGVKMTPELWEEFGFYNLSSNPEMWASDKYEMTYSFEYHHWTLKEVLTMVVDHAKDLGYDEGRKQFKKKMLKLVGGA